jgi:hypothetical protein
MSYFEADEGSLSQFSEDAVVTVPGQRLAANGRLAVVLADMTPEDRAAVQGCWDRYATVMRQRGESGW